MHVLITGGAGFIGSHTADRLLGMGHDVRVLDNLQKPVHMKGRPDYLSDKVEFIDRRVSGCQIRQIFRHGTVLAALLRQN